jgi:hypothetical protein
MDRFLHLEVLHISPYHNLVELFDDRVHSSDSSSETGHAREAIKPSEETPSSSVITIWHKKGLSDDRHPSPCEIRCESYLCLNASTVERRSGGYIRKVIEGHRSPDTRAANWMITHSYSHAREAKDAMESSHGCPSAFLPISDITMCLGMSFERIVEEKNITHVLMGPSNCGPTFVHFDRAVNS